jgi:hypothetical protein
MTSLNWISGRHNTRASESDRLYAFPFWNGTDGTVRRTFSDIISFFAWRFRRGGSLSFVQMLPSGAVAQGRYVHNKLSRIKIERGWISQRSVGRISTAFHDKYAQSLFLRPKEAEILNKAEHCFSIEDWFLSSIWETPQISIQNTFCWRVMRACVLVVHVLLLGGVLKLLEDVVNLLQFIIV